MQRVSNIKQQLGFAQAGNRLGNIMNHTDANGIVSKKLRQELFVSLCLFLQRALRGITQKKVMDIMIIDVAVLIFESKQSEQFVLRCNGIIFSLST